MKLVDLYLAGSCIVGEAPVHPSILPQLHGLTLDADAGELFNPIRPFWNSREKIEMDKIADAIQERVGKSRHSNLKVVTFEGFLG
ncbi:hypothetical protein AKJ16_DCAP05176 [Drosera capensis]